jgi:hypothetical protein
MWTAPKAGDYSFKVEVKKGAATATDTRGGYHVEPAVIPTVAIWATPPVKAQSGAFTISAGIAPKPLTGPALLPPTKHRIWFGYRQEFVGSTNVTWDESWHEVHGAHPAVWTPTPPLTPGAYAIFVHVQSFRNDMLIAEGTRGGASPSYFYRNVYVVLLPLAPCPTPVHTKNPRQPFGWVNPVTTHNSWNLPVASPQGAADCAIAGFGIDAILNHPQLRVRKLNVSCTNCHVSLMAGAPGRAWFCSALPDGFYHHQHGEPSATEETTLYKLFAAWKMSGCLD